MREILELGWTWRSPTIEGEPARHDAGNGDLMKLFSPTIGAVLIALLLQGCAAQKTMVPTGGSRADGTVKLSYEYGMFEAPKVDMAQGTVAANKRCGSWGYTGAEPFGGETRTCNSYGGGGCNRWLVTVEFQCTGGAPVYGK